MTPHASGPLRTNATAASAPRSPFDRSAPARKRWTSSARTSSPASRRTASRRRVLSPHRGFHVIRDPRDIIVSAYFSHRNSHPTDGLPHLAAHRAALQEASKEEGLLLEMEFSAHELRELGDWDYSNESILELKMEEMTVRPYETFLSIFDHFELLAEQDPTRGREQLAVSVARLANRLSRRRSLRWLRRENPRDRGDAARRGPRATLRGKH